MQNCITGSLQVGGLHTITWHPIIMDPQKTINVCMHCSRLRSDDLLRTVQQKVAYLVYAETEHGKRKCLPCVANRNKLTWMRISQQQPKSVIFCGPFTHIFERNNDRCPELLEIMMSSVKQLGKSKPESQMVGYYYGNWVLLYVQSLQRQSY